jgi:hypothetical protein
VKRLLEQSQVGTGDTVYGIEMQEQLQLTLLQSNATVSRGATTFTLTGAQRLEIIIVNPPADLNDDLIFVGCGCNRHR